MLIWEHADIHLFYLKELAEEKLKLGKFKTAQNYLSAGRSFGVYLRYAQRVKDLPIESLTRDLLVDYERYLHDSRGLRRNSSSAYMRALRAVYRRAVDDGLSAQPDPFGRVYTGVDRTLKRAVDARLVSRLVALQLPSQALRVSRDMFVFSFYARGMAFVDLAKLTYGNVRRDRLVYQRSKTHQLISVKIEPPMRTIIDRYARGRSPYLFPVLREIPFNPSEYNSALRTYNNHLHRLSREVGASGTLTSYVARHTWATTAQRLSIPTRVISESMGHTDEATTHIYLASFDVDQIDAANRKILKAVSPAKAKKSGMKKEENAETMVLAPMPSVAYCSTSTLYSADVAGSERIEMRTGLDD